MKKIITVFLFLIFLTEIFPQNKWPKRELRGTWIATVKNIDWPKSNSSSTGNQIAELVLLFEELKEANINTVYFQVRAECDALYNSKYEPWSYWLTGKQGKAPEAYFDPLEVAIRLAHARGIELHAWLNPYRAVRDVKEYQVSEKHISVTKPEWILDFGNYKMLNPGLPEVKDYISNIVVDIIKNYDVDGIHFDDYFYPYSPQISNEDIKEYNLFGKKFSDINDWRRNNINSMIAQVYDSIKTLKPHIKFGVSPFGIVENKYAGTNGFESYYRIYCDPLTWLKDKTVDYVLPQLYWEIGNKAADYSKLLPWWAQLKTDRHLYVGLFSSKISAQNWKGSKSEIGDEIRMNRKFPNVRGEVFFSAKSIADNYGGLKDSLKSRFYLYPSFVPVMNWIDSTLPAAPENVSLFADSNFISLTWQHSDLNKKDTNHLKFVIYLFSEKDKIDLQDPSKIIAINNNGKNSVIFKRSDIKENSYFVITAMDRMQNESLPSEPVFLFRRKN